MKIAYDPLIVARSGGERFCWLPAPPDAVKVDHLLVVRLNDGGLRLIPVCRDQRQFRSSDGELVACHWDGDVNAPTLREQIVAQDLMGLSVFEAAFRIVAGEITEWTDVFDEDECYIV